MVDRYYNIFVTKLKLSFSSSLERSDHPELDTSECLDSDGIHKYQSMIGAVQWAVSLRIIDFNTEVTNLASFKAEPIKGQLGDCKRVVSCVSKFK